MQIIKSVTALAGAGKTHVMINQINQSNEKYIILAPTIRLCDQIASDLNNAQVIHSEVEGIKNSSIELMRAVSDGVQVICSTHQSFAQILKSGDISINDYNLIFDEVPAALLESQLTMDQHVFDLFCSLLNFEPSTKFDGFYEISPKNIVALRTKLKAQSSEVYRHGRVKHFIECVANNAYATLIPSELFCTFKAALVNGSARLDTVSLMRPEVLSGTNSTTVMSAFFNDTEFAIVMKAQGVQFDDQDVQVRYKEHTNGHRLTVKFFTEKQNSKSFANRKTENGETNIQLICDYIKQELSNERYIFNANVSHRRLFESEENGYEVTAVHGVNDLQDIHKAVYLPALNPNPSTAAILKYLGIESGQIIHARNQLLAYQFLMRTSLRNPSSTEQVTFYCVDAHTAGFLKAEFGCNTAQVILDFVQKEDARTNNGGNKNAGRKKHSPAVKAITAELRKQTRRKNPDQDKIRQLEQQKAMLMTE